MGIREYAIEKNKTTYKMSMETPNFLEFENAIKKTLSKFNKANSIIKIKLNVEVEYIANQGPDDHFVR